MNVGPEQIPQLEQRVAAEPASAEAAALLGIAYFNAKRFDDARNTLARAVAMPAAPERAHLYLGLANEELKDWSAAHTAYVRFIEVGDAGEIKDQIRARLAYVGRQQLRQEARAVLDREQQMSDEPPTPRTLAVMPFRLVGVSEELQPLQSALADMMITDLSVSPAVTSIERVKIKAMIDEMLLAQAGFTEEGTGARVGRLLKAEHVVQGVLAQTGEGELRADGTVLNTERRAAAGNFAQSEQLDQIFDLEKQIVFNIFDAVGVTLTPAEREQINNNRTGNLMAFLAFGRGLDAMDAGNFRQASTFFRQASQLDPNFQRATQTEQEAEQITAAAEEAPTEVAAQAAAPAPAPAGGAELTRSLTNDINTTGGETMTTQTGTSTSGTSTVERVTNEQGNINQSQGRNNSVPDAVKATIRLVIQRPGA